MARPHHRKKHKAHLRQFQHKSDINTIDAKGKGSTTIAVVGAVVGLAIFYFATQGDFIWAIIGGAIGAAGGYFIGRGLDKPAKK